MSCGCGAPLKFTADGRAPNFCVLCGRAVAPSHSLRPAPASHHSLRGSWGSGAAHNSHGSIPTHTPNHSQSTRGPSPSNSIGARVASVDVVGSSLKTLGQKIKTSTTHTISSLSDKSSSSGSSTSSFTSSATATPVGVSPRGSKSFRGPSTSSASSRTLRNGNENGNERDKALALARAKADAHAKVREQTRVEEARKSAKIDTLRLEEERREQERVSEQRRLEERAREIEWEREKEKQREREREKEREWERLKVEQERLLRPTNRLKISSFTASGSPPSSVGTPSSPRQSGMDNSPKTSPRGQSAGPTPAAVAVPLPSSPASSPSAFSPPTSPGPANSPTRGVSRRGNKKLPTPPAAASQQSAKPHPATMRPKHEHSSGKLPPLPSSPSVERSQSRPPSDNSNQSSLSTRERIVQEIITTEEDYVRDLEILVSVYITPLREEQIITKSEVNSIFSNLEMLCKVNKEIFLPALKSGSVAQAFHGVMDYLKLYAVYCSNQDTAMSAIHSLRKSNSAFDSFLTACSKSPECRGLDLGGFLIKPIQRICKYPLLLRELLKNTLETHAEYASLNSALQKITTTVEGINEKKSELDKSARLYELSQKIEHKGDLKLLDSPGRRFISEGLLSQLSSKDLLGKKIQWKTDGYYFLCTDLFLFCKANSSSGTFKLKLQLLLNRAVCNDTEVEGHQNAFELMQIGRQRLLFCTATPEKKLELRKEIDTVLSSFLAARYTKYVEKERERSLRLKVSPLASGASEEDWNVTSFEEWKKGLTRKQTAPPTPAKDSAIRFICHSPEHEQRVLKINEPAPSLLALQGEIRKKFDLAPSAGFRIVYPRAEGLWEMCPLAEQKDLDTIIELKISDLYLTWV